MRCQVVGNQGVSGKKKVAYSEWEIKVSTESVGRVLLRKCCNSNVKGIAIRKP